MANTSPNSGLKTLDGHNNKLAERKQKSLATARQSSKECLASQLLLAATFSGKELTAPEVRMWESILGPHTPAEIEHGFHEYFSHGKTFMPQPGEIRELILVWRADRAREARACKTDQMLKENREARETGNTISFGEVLQKIKGIAATKSMESQRAEAPTAQGLAPGQDPQGSRAHAVPPLTDSKDLGS